MLRVLIFGATGRTGACVVEQLLAANAAAAASPLYRLSLFVRSPGKLPAAVSSNPAVTVITGSVSDAAAIAAAVRGMDAVMFTLGHVYGERDSTWMTTCTTSIIAGMRAHGVRRLVDMTGVVNSIPRDGSVLVYSLMWAWLRVAKPTVLVDHATRTEAITAAGEGGHIVYTIVRPPILTDGGQLCTCAITAPCTCGRVHIAAAADSSRCTSTVSRRDVARFMCSLLHSSEWNNAQPVISALM